MFRYFVCFHRTNPHHLSHALSVYVHPCADLSCQPKRWCDYYLYTKNIKVIVRNTCVLKYKTLS
jgi:hypothetical protein